MAHGFELAGPIPESGVTVSDLRRQAASARKGILASTRSSGDVALDEELYSQTLNEVKKGWLEGPLDLGLLSNFASVTRRFATRQGPKCRAIGNFSESLINQTSSSVESVTVHTADVIAGSLAYRFDCAKQLNKSEAIVAQAWDLRSAYKQLCVSEDALTESYLSVWNPDKCRAEIFLQLVLPFGACSSVTGFIRAAIALWALGASGLSLHWSNYFDDFLIFSSAKIARHTELSVIFLTVICSNVI